MEYVIYLNVPTYAKQYLLKHFSEDGKILKCKNTPMEGFMMNTLRRRGELFNKEEEMGNLPVAIPNVSSKKKKECYNYLSAKNRSRLAKMLKSIMFSHYWFFMLPMLKASTADRHKKNKENTIMKFTERFFQENGIEMSDEALNRFLVEINREKGRLNKVYGITM